ncbi:MAG: SH3 domain-containing protein [Lachnospiraceae bacterium]|nr:SH3 domain-containing protein [Lachnospiraceae bacterium]
MKKARNGIFPFLIMICFLLAACGKTTGTDGNVAAGVTAAEEDEPAATVTPAPTAGPDETEDGPGEDAVSADNADSVSTDSVSIDSVSDDSASENTASENTASENAVSGNSASDNAAGAADKPAEKEPDLSRVTEWEKPRTMYASVRVNLRKGPSVEYRRVGELVRGEEVSIFGQDAGGWYELLRGGQICFVCNSYLAETPPADPTPVPVPETTPAPAAPTPAPAPVVSAPAGVVIVGDSRCVGMREATGGGGVSWICENSKEYEWFKGTAIPQLDAIVGKGTKVVICMGVNDTDHAYSYAPLINQKAAEWAARGARTYFVSVNPVGDNPYTNMDNVVNFNNIMINNLSGVKYIDTCNWLIANGYVCNDGLHYDPTTNQRIFSVIIGSL